MLAPKGILMLQSFVFGPSWSCRVLWGNGNFLNSGKTIQNRWRVREKDKAGWKCEGKGREA